MTSLKQQQQQWQQEEPLHLVLVADISTQATVLITTPKQPVNRNSPIDLQTHQVACDLDL